MRYEARSEYVQERIKHTTWEERHEIAKLLAIERYALDGHIHGYAHSAQIHALWSSHSDEFRTILAELNPELLEYWLEREVKHERERVELVRARGTEEAEEYCAWLAAGGRP